MKTCLNCKNIIKEKNKFCSVKCQKEYEYNEYIKRWKKGEENGLRGEYQISMHIKTYLLKKYNNKCSKCGWGEKIYIQIISH